MQRSPAYYNAAAPAAASVVWPGPAYPNRPWACRPAHSLPVSLLAFFSFSFFFLCLYAQCFTTTSYSTRTPHPSPSTGARSSWAWNISMNFMSGGSLRGAKP